VLYYESMLSIESKYIRLISSRLRNFKQKKDYLWNFSCPICGDSKKNLSKARGYVFQKGTNLFFNCHNCGVGTNLGNLIKQVDPSLHKEYVLERYKSGESGFSNFKSPSFDIPAPRFDKVAKEKHFEHAEWVSKLPSGHFCLVYCTNRRFLSIMRDTLLFTPNYKKFCDALVPNHGKEITADARLVIPFYDKYNTLIGVSGRALENSDYKLRYVTLRTTESQDKLIYGIDKVNTNELVKIVEGPLDSMFLTNCVGSGDSALIQTAKLIDAENKVLIFDNEPRNKEIVKLMSDAIKLGYDVVIWPDTMEEKDINEMVMAGFSPDEIERIISSNTFTGLRAQMKFISWKKI
jgi:transcription elongation factor Elf1